MRILVVEDDLELCRAVCHLLEKNGFLTGVAHTAFTAVDLALTGAYDCILVDVMLPDGDGIQLVEQLRTLEVTTPILVLTARNEPVDRVNGLNSGADDYLGKPFDADELVARVEALLRRSGGQTSLETIHHGTLTLHRGSRTLAFKGKTLELSSKEFLLMECLIRHPNQVLARNQLIEQVWGPDVELAENALDTYVYFLRKKGSTIGIKNLIKTVRGEGYMIHPNL